MLDTKNTVIDGIRTVIYDNDPQGRPEAVVFIHGNPGAIEDWESLLPAVSEFSRAVAMDLPGYGRAEHPTHFDFSIGGYATFIEHLLDAQRVERAHLVLHDFGGPFGLAWAMARPEALASVTLINTGVLPGYHWHKFARVWQTPVIGELFQFAANATLLRRALDADNPKPLPEAFHARVARDADWGHKRAVLELYRNSKDALANTQPLIDMLRGQDVPACVVWGAEDAYIPVEFAAKQTAAFPRAQVHTLQGRGHWPFIDDPVAVREIVVPFLRTQVGQVGQVETPGD